ncbi:MAG: hypothetical protein Q8O98_02785 [bacterium]|nr:hypothetical protein [bacterium]MDZ4205636.1 hypothetical protein [Patescibacteria group bacterium]
MGIKNFFLKQMLKRKLSGMPADQQEVIMNLVEEHPEVFEKIGAEIKQKQKEGKGETEATMEVMRKHQAELQKLMHR